MTSTKRTPDLVARCPWCGASGPMEVHHIAGSFRGRPWHPATVPACLDCHRNHLTPWQRNARPPLNGVPRGRRPAMLLAWGLLHLLKLTGQRRAASRMERDAAVVESAAALRDAHEVPLPRWSPVAPPTGPDDGLTVRTLVELMPLVCDDRRILDWFHDLNLETATHEETLSFLRSVVTHPIILAGLPPAEERRS